MDSYFCFSAINFYSISQSLSPEAILLGEITRRKHQCNHVFERNVVYTRLITKEVAQQHLRYTKVVRRWFSGRNLEILIPYVCVCMLVDIRSREYWSKNHAMVVSTEIAPDVNKFYLSTAIFVQFVGMYLDIYTYVCCSYTYMQPVISLSLTHSVSLHR